jgi:uncharacterized cupin superfamily protein
MTLPVAPNGYRLADGWAEGLWFSGGLLTYKTTGEQTHGLLALAEVHAPRGTGSPKHRHHHEDEAWYIIDGELTLWLGDTPSTPPAPAPSRSARAGSSTGSKSPRPRRGS